MKVNFLNILKPFLVIFVFSIFLYNSLNYLDPDFGWHLKAGEEVYKTKSAPWSENYNYTLEGKFWVDHEWFLNLICYLVYTKIGYFALNVIFALTATIVFLFVNLFYLKKYIKDNLHFLFILLIELIALIGILPHSGVRMQEFSVLFFLIELIIIDNFQTTLKVKLLWYLPLLFFVWANIHGGFMLGLVVLWFFLFISFFAPILTKYFKIDFFEFAVFNKKDIYKIFHASLLSSFSVLLTPYHYKYFTFMLSYTNTYYLSHIAEWLPAFSAPIIYSQQAYYVFFIIIVIFLFINKKDKKINLWYFLLSLLLFISAFKSRRNFPLFFIASIPLITIATDSFNLNNLKFFNSFKSSIYLKLNILFVLFLSITLFFTNANYTDSPFENKKFCKSYPCEALKTIKNLPQNDLKIYNDYGSGGFLVWNWPEQKIFIDGRLPMLMLNNHSFLEEYYEFYNKDKISEKLNQYNINLVQGKKTKIQKYNWFERFFLGLKNSPNEKNPLEEYLESRNEWKKIFEDNNFFVYHKL